MKRRVLLTTFGVTMVSVVSMAIDFIMQVYFLKSLGVGAESDALAISNSISGYVVLTIITSWSVTVTRRLLKLKVKEPDEFDEETSNVINLTSLVLGLFVALEFLGANFIVKIVSPGISEDVFYTATLLVRISAFQILFNGLNTLLTSIKFIKKEIIAPELFLLVSKIIVFSYLFIFRPQSVVTFQILTVVAGFVQLLLMVWKLNIKYSFYFNWRSSYLKESVILALPIIIGSMLGKSNSVVDKNLGSLLPEGSITTLSYAFKFNRVLLVIFGQGISLALGPFVAEKIFEKDYEQVERGLIMQFKYLFLIFFLLAPLAYFTSFPGMYLLLGRGKLSMEEVAQISNVFVLYYPYLLGAVGAGFITNLFYTMKKVGFLPLANLISLVSYYVLARLLMNWLGMYGISLSYSLTIISTAISYFIIYNKFQPMKRLKELSSILIKVIPIALITFTVMNFIPINYDYDSVISIIINLGIMTIIWGVLSSALVWVLKIQEVHSLAESIFKKNSNR